MRSPKVFGVVLPLLFLAASTPVRAVSDSDTISATLEVLEGVTVTAVQNVDAGSVLDQTSIGGQLKLDCDGVVSQSDGNTNLIFSGSSQPGRFDISGPNGQVYTLDVSITDDDPSDGVVNYRVGAVATTLGGAATQACTAFANTGVSFIDAAATLDDTVYIGVIADIQAGAAPGTKTATITASATF